MGWLIFFVISLLAALVCIPIKQWKRLWPSGLIAMVFLYAIDSTLMGLEAFSYRYGIARLSGLPFFYWISSFFGGMLLTYYYPDKKKWQVSYVLLAAFVFLIMELVMAWLGYFHYNRWNPLKSYFLNIFGFLGVLFVAQWLGTAGKKIRS